MALRQISNLSRLSSRIIFSNTRLASGDRGDGAGQGGGSGGSIRDAGGSFGKMEAAHEEQYFRKKQAEQLADLKDHIHTEIKDLKDDIDRHQKRLKELEAMEKGGK